MLKIFPEDTIQKKVNGVFRVGLVGIGVAFAGALYGEAKDDIVLWMVSMGVLLVCGFIAVIYLMCVARTFTRSSGGVLEVQDGKVKTFHSKPFVYKTKDVWGPGKAELVPFSLKPINVSKTIIASVDDNALFYKVECSVIPSSFSQYYYSFLRTGDLREYEIKCPEHVVENQVYNFLWQARLGIIQRHRLYYGRCEESAIQRDTDYDAKIYLSEQLASYGLAVAKLTSTYLVCPFIIDKER